MNDKEHVYRKISFDKECLMDIITSFTSLRDLDYFYCDLMNFLKCMGDLLNASAPESDKTESDKPEGDKREQFRIWLMGNCVAVTTYYIMENIEVYNRLMKLLKVNVENLQCTEEELLRKIEGVDNDLQEYV